MAEPISRWLVMVIGLIVVFAGLIALIIIISLLSFFVRKFAKKPQTKESDNNEAVNSSQTSGSDLQGVKPDERRQIIAAISAAIATTMGTTPKGIRIHSIKKIEK